MTIIPDGYAEASLKFSMSESTRFAYCVFGIANNADQSAQAIATHVGTDFEESLMPLLSIGVSLVGVKVVKSNGAYYEDNEVYVGGEAGAYMVPQVAYLLKKQNDLIGRENRGRMYLPGVTNENVGNNGTLDAPFKDELTTAGNAFVGKLFADDVPMVILHTGLAEPSFVERLEADNMVATQRRRLR